ncbi:MAG: PaaX family transcriptional regulator [Hyphomicrobiales bacterium]|nr:MAG: PaaX family transcriptional regulator [Hyphomicrobiales bacterium]
MSSTEFANHTSILTTGQTHRVWSLLVTVFGDLSDGADSWISGATLNKITAAIGIKPEATRVALHRLRKDKWIESKRHGRTSTYALTLTGQEQSDAARPRIYAQANAVTDCQLVIVEPGTTSPISNPATLAITPDLLLSSDFDGFADALLLDVPTPLPQWMRRRVCGAALIHETRNTHSAFVKLNTALQTHPITAPLEIAVLRVLIVHSWRRIVLRTPNLPDNVFPDDWLGADCRKLSVTLLAALPRPALSQLKDAAAHEQAA